MKYYCLGIKGTGMSTLAQILNDLGNTVIGYDDNTSHKFTQEGLEDRNIDIYCDGSLELDKDMIVTYSVALSENHPELVRCKNSGCTIKSYAEIMGEVVSMFSSIGVSGTHGKTSTSSIIKHVLENTIGCNYFIGAGDGYATRENEYFVVESDEFNRHFTYYHPKYSIITNIEAEHLECYKDVDDIRNSFEIFANNTSDLVVANGDNSEVRKINYNSSVIFYGFGFNNDVIVKNLNLNENGSIFDIYFKEDLYGSFEIPLYGKHMVLNACAAIIILNKLGISKEDIYAYLKTFKNAKRRFAIENYHDSIILDDYAHHPTEIKATLDAVRQKFPDRRIVVIFKPNTYSRTRDFKYEFIDALNTADKAYITEIECNREDPKDYPGVSSNMLLSGVNDGELISEETIDKLTHELNSIICFMGCASVSGLIDSYKKFVDKKILEEDM